MNHHFDMIKGEKSNNSQWRLNILRAKPGCLLLDKFYISHCFDLASYYLTIAEALLTMYLKLES
jgi:hypothetical protein